MDWALITAAAIAGFAGSAHCAGMCGPIVGLFESSPQDGMTPAVRRTGYQLGRLGFYVTLGLLAGGLSAFALSVMPVKMATVALRILAAVMLILIGVKLVFGGRGTSWLDRAGQAVWRRMSPLARHVMPMDRFGKAVAVGYIWGAIPCGLVYATLGLAAASGHALGGALVMATFWLGTLPALTAIGAGAKAAFNGRYRKLAGVATILAACASLALLIPRDGGMDHGAHAMPAAQAEMPHQH